MHQDRSSYRLLLKAILDVPKKSALSPEFPLVNSMRLKSFKR